MPVLIQGICAHHNVKQCVQAKLCCSSAAQVWQPQFTHNSAWINHTSGVEQYVKDTASTCSMHNACHIEISGSYLPGKTGARAPLKRVVVHGVGDPQCVEVEVHGLGDLHGVVEESCHVCDEVLRRVCKVHDLHGVVEEVRREGDLHGVVKGRDYVPGAGGAEDEEAHGGEYLEVHDRGAVCQVWELLLAGSSAASAREKVAGRECGAPLVQTALESEVAGHARGGEEGILVRSAPGRVRDDVGACGVRDVDGARGVREVPNVGGDCGVIAAQYGKSEDDDDRGEVSAGRA